MRNNSQTSIVILLLLAVGSVRAEVFFLSPTGDDQASGTRQSPWASLNHAAAKAKPGDTIKLLPGTYHQNASVSGCRGAPDAPITFEAEGEVLFDGSYSPKQWRAEGGGVYSCENKSVDGAFAASVNGRLLLGPSVQPAFKKVLGDPANLKRGQCNRTEERTYIRLLYDRDPNHADVRLAAGISIVLEDTHHTVWRGINTGWGLDGYKLVRGSSNNRIVDAEIHHVLQGILETKGSEQYPACQSNTFEGLHIHDVGPTKYNHGIYTSGHRTRIVQCRFERITGAAIQSYPTSDACEYTGNRIRVPLPRWAPEDFTTKATAKPTRYYAAMNIWGHGRHRVTGNTIYGPFSMGISVNSSNNRIAKNRITLTHGGTAIYQHENQTGNELSDNRVRVTKR